jgi:AcrR family transcriptional regulator
VLVGEDNRTRILDLAVAAIDAGGEAALRVADIVSEAGVTPPVLYHYFASREGLVVAAQIERYTRQTHADIAAIARAVAACESRGDLRTALLVTWQRSLAQRAESRWRRTSVVGSAYARPELEAAIARAQDEIVAGLVAIFEPCRERGWLRSEIDLPSTVAWHHGVLISRVFIERGALEVDPLEWDRLTLDALERAFFGA